MQRLSHLSLSAFSPHKEWEPMGFLKASACETQRLFSAEDFVSQVDVH